jgi:phosphoribosylamine--glycine ligase
MALVDGKRAAALPVAQDHKRLLEGDLGPNTGGMGAYAPAPFLDDAERERLVDLTILPVVELLGSMGCEYRGILFAGLMLTADGPKVLEFNCRLGDPEAQAVLPLLDCDLLPLLRQVAEGGLIHDVKWEPGAAVGVVLAAAGYPERPSTGATVRGLDSLPNGVLAFHAGTERDSSGQTLGCAGRVLTVVGRGSDVDEAAEKAYAAPVRFEGMQRRMDIGWQARTASRFQPWVSDRETVGVA